jgi:hypothetical protein
MAANVHGDDVAGFEKGQPVTAAKLLIKVIVYSIARRYS